MKEGKKNKPQPKHRYPRSKRGNEEDNVHKIYYY